MAWAACASHVETTERRLDVAPQIATTVLVDRVPMGHQVGLLKAARKARTPQAWGTSVCHAKRESTVAPVQRCVPDARHTAQPCRLGARTKHSAGAHLVTNDMDTVSRRAAWHHTPMVWAAFASHVETMARRLDVAPQTATTVLVNRVPMGNQADRSFHAQCMERR